MLDQTIKYFLDMTVSACDITIKVLPCECGEGPDLNIEHCEGCSYHKV
jgi:hypothetical protein